MAIPHAEKLIERARKGERLLAKERRHCVSFIMTAHPQTTNVEMAELFRVSDRQIRDDKKVIRQERAKIIKEDDISLVIADISIAFDNQIRDIEHSKRKCKLGGRPYLEHCKAIANLSRDRVKLLQDLGWLPKTLGNLSVERYEYKAIVNERVGSIDTRAVEFGDDDIQDAEFTEQKLLPAVE